jgi:hypothetical protein
MKLRWWLEARCHWAVMDSSVTVPASPSEIRIGDTLRVQDSDGHTHSDVSELAQRGMFEVGWIT